MKNVQELVRDVCERPEMYVGERRFVTVSAWLNGYGSALIETKNAGEAVGLAKLRLKPPSNWRAASFLPFVVYHNNHEYSI
jgi:hypothetical protein